MNQQPIATILVSRPGIMRQSLQTSLTMYSWITLVAVCGDGLTALSQVTQQRPRLVIIDANLLDEEVHALLTAIKAEQPTTRCLVLAQSIHREEAILASGADVVIPREGWVQWAPTCLAQLMR
jgi:DNA-binding NarL/FixJ family response regulator